MVPGTHQPSPSYGLKGGGLQIMAEGRGYDVLMFIFVNSDP